MVNSMRKQILDLLVAHPGTQWNGVREAMAKAHANPSKGVDRSLVASHTDEVLWDLITERAITFGSENGQSEARYPFIYATKLGKALAGGQHQLHDPTAYVLAVKRQVPTLDATVALYLAEAVGAFERGLLLGSAVLSGAAAERQIFLLLVAIERWDLDAARKAKAKKVLENGRLPSAIALLQAAIQDGIDRELIPYSVHQGLTTHLLSIHEMVRVQRNEAVHQGSSTVSRDKVFLTLQTLPVAIESVERLIAFLKTKSPSGEPASGS